MIRKYRGASFIAVSAITQPSDSGHSQESLALPLVRAAAEPTEDSESPYAEDHECAEAVT
jgi:hypothetical protein